MMESNVTSFQFLNTSILQTSISSQPTIVIQIINILTPIYYMLAAYYIPLTMIVTTLNNSLCLIVFVYDKDFYEKTSKNSRVYYIVLALSDIAANYSFGLTFFPGDGIYTITNGKFSM